MTLKFPLAFIAPNYVSFTEPLLSHTLRTPVVIDVTEPGLVTGRVKGKGEEGQPAERGNKEDRGWAHELSAPISTHMEPNAVPPDTHCEAVGSMGLQVPCTRYACGSWGREHLGSHWCGSFRHLCSIAINNNNYYWHKESHHGWVTNVARQEVKLVISVLLSFQRTCSQDNLTIQYDSLLQKLGQGVFSLGRPPLLTGGAKNRQ